MPTLDTSFLVDLIRQKPAALEKIESKMGRAIEMAVLHLRRAYNCHGSDQVRDAFFLR